MHTTVDFSAFPELQGQAVAGVYRNLGTEPEFDIDGYPEHEVRSPSLDTSRMDWLTTLARDHSTST